MPKQHTEEQFPLLLVLMGEQDLSRDNKRFSGRARFNGIASGASAIITEWPTYVSSCWLTTLLCAFVLFTLTILISCCMPYQEHVRIPRCALDNQLKGNNTIHLVHTSHHWYPEQLELLSNITTAFPKHQIHLIIICHALPTTNEIIKMTNTTKLNETYYNITPTRRNEDFIENFTRQHPNILVSHETYKNIFDNSPLFANWHFLNAQTKIFAARVVQMWQYGGLSYDLLNHRMHRKLCQNCTSFSEKKVQEFIRTGVERYEKLTSDSLSVDMNGFHMECKTPCHAFFGNLLNKLKKANQNSSIRRILGGSVFSYCRAGLIDRESCHVQSIFF